MTTMEKFLSQDQRFQQNALMETAMRGQEILQCMLEEGVIYVNEDHFTTWQILAGIARKFEYENFDTDRYYNDYLDLTDEYFRKELSAAYE